MARGDRIVVHDGKMVVMNEKIIMGPCPAFEFKVNDLPLKDFYRKTIDEAVSITLAGANYEYMPLGCSLSSGGGSLSGSGGIFDSWGKQYGSWSGGVSSGPDVVQGVKSGSFMLYDVTPGHEERLDFRYRTIRPKKGHTYLVEFGFIVYSTSTCTSNRDGQPSTTDSWNEVQSYGTFAEFSVEASEGGKMAVVGQRFLPASELYGKYGNVLAFLPTRYRVGAVMPAGISFSGNTVFYVDGPVEFDATVSIGPVKQEGVIP